MTEGQAPSSSRGARLQLAAIGPQNVLIQGNDFSFFQTRFKRHTKFSMETREASALSPVTFGQTCTFDIPITADLLQGIGIQLTLPSFLRVHPQLDTWKPDIGHVLIRRAKIMIDELVIADHERLWFDIRKKVTSREDSSKRRAIDAMIGHDPMPIHAAAHAHTLTFPLDLPVSTATPFPMVVLQGAARHVMTLQLELEQLEACLNVSSAARDPDAVFESTLFVSSTMFVVHMRDPVDDFRDVVVTIGDDTLTFTLDPNQMSLTVDASPYDPALPVLVTSGGVSRYVLAPGGKPVETYKTLDVTALYDVVFLDTEERHVFLRSVNHYMYETVLDQEAKTYRENVSTDGSIQRVNIPIVKIDLSEINFPVRYLVWVAYNDDFSGQFFVYHDWIDSTKFVLQNTEIISNPNDYFQTVTRYRAGANVCVDHNDGIGMLSFALRPGLPDISGSIGFDKTKLPYLEMHLNEASHGVSGVVKVFAICRRILQLEKGSIKFVTI